MFEDFLLSTNWAPSLQDFDLRNSKHCLYEILICAQRTRLHFCPELWLLSFRVRSGTSTPVNEKLFEIKLLFVCFHIEESTSSHYHMGAPIDSTVSRGAEVLNFLPFVNFLFTILTWPRRTRVDFCRSIGFCVIWVCIRSSSSSLHTGSEIRLA